MKEVRFVNKQALKEFKSFPSQIQEQFANDINAICKDRRQFSNFKNAVYILHSFTKTTNGVDRKAMHTAKSRYAQMMVEVSTYH